MTHSNKGGILAKILALQGSHTSQGSNSINAILARAQKINTYLFVYATVLVAFFLRVYRLADKNVWWDEGWSLWLARQDFIAIALRTASDEHPPLHYWMLHIWDSLVGWDAFTARFLSVAFGVLTVGLIYRIGRRSGGAWIGVLAALFLATARFHVWWSQDIKNYTPSIFFAFAAVWFALNVIASPERAKQSPRSTWESAPRHLSLVTRHVLLYALCAALAMLTHYLAALVLLALNLYVLLRLTLYYLRPASPPLLRSPASLLAWLLANLLAAVLFAPWLALYLQNAQAWSAAPAFDFGLFVKLVATALPLGITTNIEDYAGLTIGFTTIVVLGIITVTLALAGSARVARSREAATKQSPRYMERASLPEFTQSRVEGVGRNDTLLFVLIVLLPPILIYALSLTPVSFFAPKIQARYLLILYPAYAILIAFGVALFRKFSLYLALAATIFVLVASAIALRDYYAERRLTDEYATLANTINSFARQGDLVLLDTDQEWPTFLYYLRAPLEWIGAPNGKTMTDSDADSLVRRALNRGSAVWLVAIPDALATDPARLLETRLARELPKRLDQTFGDKRVALFAREGRDMTQVFQTNLHIQHPMPFPFGSQFDPNGYQAQLIGYDLSIREAKAGDTIYVTTYWFAAATRGEMQLVDSSNRVLDSTPFDLATGKDVRVVTALNIPANAACEYGVRVRVSEQSVEIARVNVELRAASVSAGSIAHPVDYGLGESIHLIGYDLQTTALRVGDQVPITLYWRADQPISKNYVVFVHLLGMELNAAQNNFLWGQIDRVPRDGAYPTTAWQPDQTVADAYRVPIAPNAPAGKYKIEVGMYDVTTGARLKLSDGQDNIIIAEIEIVR